MSNNPKKNRDAGSGKYVSKDYAKANPKTTVGESTKRSAAKKTSQVFKPIVSSNLHSAFYDRNWKELTVRFKNGGAHKYFDVSPSLYRDFEKLFDGKTGSAGSFFAKQIRFLSNEKLEDWQTPHTT